MHLRRRRHASPARPRHFSLPRSRRGGGSHAWRGPGDDGPGHGSRHAHAYAHVQPPLLGREWRGSPAGRHPALRHHGRASAGEPPRGRGEPSYMPGQLGAEEWWREEDEMLASAHMLQLERREVQLWRERGRPGERSAAAAAWEAEGARGRRRAAGREEAQLASAAVREEGRGEEGPAGQPWERPSYMDLEAQPAAAAPRPRGAPPQGESATVWCCWSPQAGGVEGVPHFTLPKTALCQRGLSQHFLTLSTVPTARCLALCRPGQRGGGPSPQQLGSGSPTAALLPGGACPAGTAAAGAGAAGLSSRPGGGGGRAAAGAQSKRFFAGAARSYRGACCACSGGQRQHCQQGRRACRAAAAGAAGGRPACGGAARYCGDRPH